MRVAMTGATGFVGRRTLELLLAAGHDVVALARQPERVQVHSNCRVVKGDLSDEAALSQLINGTDAVLHIAGAVSAPSRAAYCRVNVEGSRAVASAAAKCGVRKFTFVSSLAARERHLNDYAASKAEAEDVVRSASGLDVTVVRPSAVYGPGDLATLPLLQVLLSRTAFIPGAAASQFSMVHVDDVARVLVESIGSPSGNFELDDGDGGHSWPELMALTQSQFGSPQRYVYIPRRLAMMIGRVGTAWGRLSGKAALVNAGQMAQLYHSDWVVRGEPWPLQQRIPLAKGLPETIRWYQSQGMLPQRAAVVTSAAKQDKT